MALKFSLKPGAWERHLQRKYHNPLFASGNDITQQHVDAARFRDEEERKEFQKAFETLLHEVSSLASQVESEVVLAMKTRADTLYEECAGLGGDFSLEKQGLKKLGYLILDLLMESNRDNTKTGEELEHERQARQMHFELLEIPLIAHLLRPESPISQDELVATLLNEEETGLRAAMSLFTQEQKLFLYDSAKTLLTQLREKEHELPEAWLHLEIMAQALNTED